AAWLMERRWLGCKGAEPVRAHVLDAGGMPGAELPAAMSRVEVHLNDGRVERYQIPLVLRQEREPSAGTLARVDVVDVIEGVDAANVLDGADSAGSDSAGRAGDGEPWWIADGGSDVAVARRILLAFAEGESFREGDVEWRFEAEEGVDLSALPHASPQPAGAEQSNTSLR